MVADYNHIQNNSEVENSKDIFLKIHGVGPSAAQKLVDEGYDRNMLFKTLNDLFVKSPKIKKNFTLRTSKTPKKETKEIFKIKSDILIYDCKKQITLTIEEFKDKYPKALISNLKTRDSLYKRYILKDKIRTSKVVKSWKTIKDLETGEEKRFNLIEFSNHLGIKQNNLWKFFNGDQKKFKNRYIILE